MISRKEALGRYAALQRERALAQRAAAVGVLAVGAGLVLLLTDGEGRARGLLLASAANVLIGLWTYSGAKREAATLLAALTSLG